jgi:hypothetical protein
MYQAVLDATSLRQGDVLKGVYLPRYSLLNLSLLHKLDKEGELQFDDRAVMKASRGFAVVLSQCCEFNEGKRNAFSLARLVKAKEALLPKISMWGVNLAELVPARYTKMAVDILQAANKLDEEHPNNAAVNVYLYDVHGNVLTEPYIVDFTQVFSIKIEDSPKLLKMKVLELDNEHRLEFQLKLGYFYSRPAE